jgi:hypothetical protein
LNLWKKAISTGLTATMLASLLVTATVGTVSAYGSVIPYTTDVVSRPADGVSFITLTFGGNSLHVITNVAVTGGTFLGGTDTFLGKTGTSVTVTNTAVNAGSKLYLASTTAGTAIVTVSFSDGVQTVDSIQSFTFTAAASKVVSVGNTTNNIAANGDATCTAVSAFATTQVGTTGKAVCTKVRDGDGVDITTGISAKYTISGPGSIGTLGAGTFTDTTSPFAAEIFSNGISGESTIKTTITYLNVDYVLPDKTFTFYGDPKTAELTANVSSVITDCASNNIVAVVTAGDCLAHGATDGLRLLVKDAAGTRVRDITGWTVTATVAPFNLLTVNFPGTWTYSSSNPGFAIPYTCGPDALQGTVAIKLTKGTTTVTSGTVAISCVDALTSLQVGSFTVGATATSLVPGGITTITVTVKDDNGFPAPDGTVVTAAANAGAVVSSDGNNTTKTSNGVGTFTYLAPSAAGLATVTAFVSNAGGPNSVSLTIGAGVASGGTNASHLGLSNSGTFTTATKIQVRGKYVTWRLHFPASAVGQSAAIWIATKNSAGVWSSFTKLTGRTIDSAGNAYFHYRSASVRWISIKGIALNISTPARQARWR